MKKVILNILLGIACGCTILVLLGIIFTLTNSKATLFLSQNFIHQAIAAMLVGIGFCLPALIYDQPRISRGGQVAIHLGSGFIIFTIVALCAGWIPLSYGLGAIALFFIIAIVATLLIWCGFYLYYRSEAKKINAKLQERHER